MSNPQILVTGASGFLGNAITTTLVESGLAPTLLLRNTSVFKNKDVSNAAEILRFDHTGQLSSAIANRHFDLVIHTAGTYGRKGETWAALVDSNVKLGLELINAIKQTGKKTTFINTSTALNSMVSAYALTKNQFSTWGELLAAELPNQLRFIDVKLQHMFGPGDDASKFTSRVISACINNEHKLPLTHGRQRRDFIYIDDVVSAYLKLINTHNQLPNFESYDLGLGEAPTVREFVELVRREARSATELDFGAVTLRPQEPLICVANIQKLNALGWTPKLSLEDAVKLTIQKEKSL